MLFQAAALLVLYAVAPSSATGRAPRSLYGVYPRSVSVKRAVPFSAASPLTVSENVLTLSKKQTRKPGGAAALLKHDTSK